MRESATNEVCDDEEDDDNDDVVGDDDDDEDGDDEEENDVEDEQVVDDKVAEKTKVRTVKERMEVAEQTSKKSKNGTKTDCKHDMAGGWTAFYDPSYFRDGNRYCGSACSGCSRVFVSVASKANRSIVVRSGKCCVYLCSVESKSDCKCLMCAECWTSKFSSEGRSSRRRG
jgi:hypothetical protein